MAATLQDECESHCQKRWDSISTETKSILSMGEPEVREFFLLLWQKQFYQTVAEAYERQLTAGNL